MIVRATRAPVVVPASWTVRSDTADDARRDADRILDRPKYQPSDVPRPFRGVLEWMGDRLEPVADAIAEVFDEPAIGSVVLAIVVATVAVAAVTAIRRRDTAAGTAIRHRRDLSTDPDTLDRASDEAEQAGDLERALRLRFRAGLLRLHRLGAIDHVEGVTSGQVARRLAMPEFDDMAATFDEVVYGRRRPSVDDVARARATWPVVISGARR